MPWIGVASGAMIIAPMTVAVESPITPADAITAADEQQPEAAQLRGRVAREQIDGVAHLLGSTQLAAEPRRDALVGQDRHRAILAAGREVRFTPVG